MATTKQGILKRISTNQFLVSFDDRAKAPTAPDVWIADQTKATVFVNHDLYFTQSQVISLYGSKDIQIMYQ